MQKISLHCVVDSWRYSRQQFYQQDVQTYSLTRSLFLKCFILHEFSEFFLDGQPWYKGLGLSIREGEPFIFAEPKAVEMFKPVAAGLGGVSYYATDAATETEEFLSSDIVVETEVFEELFECRHELRRISLQCIGANAALDWDGHPSWEPSRPAQPERSLFVVGYDYYISSSKE